MSRSLLFLAFLCPFYTFAQLQLSAHVGGALNDFGNEIMPAGYVFKAKAAYIVSDAVSTGLGFRHTNALDNGVNSVFAFVDFGGNFGRAEAYAGPELGYFPYHGRLEQTIYGFPFDVSGFGLEFGGHLGFSYKLSK